MTSYAEERKQCQPSARKANLVSHQSALAEEGTGSAKPERKQRQAHNEEHHRATHWRLDKLQEVHLGA
ncbi:MAG: hypothetical protein K1W14_04415 [Muribaculaceae bacterium]